MSYKKISKILNIDPKTAKKAVFNNISSPLWGEEKEVNPMRLPFGIYNLINPERYIWSQARILHETDQALLAYNGMKIWIPKSRIGRIKLRNNIFEIYILEAYGELRTSRDNPPNDTGKVMSYCRDLSSISERINSSNSLPIKGNT